MMSQIFEKEKSKPKIEKERNLYYILNPILAHFFNQGSAPNI